ncbi:Protein trichome birefringence-like [Actinidia chinensis var. chinensis]|uniref:Protein trichome birefringence-like n=1 Tax=Actinidia chinensis var. chinensis TaxID=1590841 RepID=A0A2R6S210_ACTCC|nr:Protein trichome birefringence-like [Actinidia chinensis var. chinensis]
MSCTHQNAKSLVSQMRFNTLKLSKMLNITFNCYKKTILLLILTLLLVTFYLPFLKQQCQEIRFKKPLSRAQWGVIHSNDSVRARLENKCNMFRGTWVPYPKGPYYTNESRCVIRDGQNCMKFGRPDTEFMKWRWKPDECELPLFDATRFLELLRGKSMAFVGDSVARNQMESLGCLLSHVTDFVDESNTKDSRYRHWFYTDYNFTLTFLWTTHLVKAHGADTSSINSIDLYLDEVDDAWATRVEDYDYVIISSGNWFYKQLTYYEKHKVVGCSQCMEKNMTDLTMYYGYRRAFQTAFRTLLDLQNFKGTSVLLGLLGTGPRILEGRPAQTNRSKGPGRGRSKLLRRGDQTKVMTAGPRTQKRVAEYIERTFV